MPVLVNSVYGGPAANAYLTLTLATDLLEAHKLAARFACWTDAGEADQQAAILQATREIDARRWVGERWYSEQRLAFPRSVEGYEREAGYFSAYDPAGAAQLVTSDRHFRDQKERVELACAFQALHVIEMEGENAHRIQQFHGMSGWSRGQGFSESASYGKPSEILCPEAMDQLVIFHRATVKTARGGTEPSLEYS